MDSDVSKRSQLQKLAYTSLAEYFQEHDNEVVEIAILPPSVQPPDGVLIQEESSLGISKKALALAYMEARRLFFANRQSKDPSTINQTIQATKVILLFDPEHLTAANYRKRVLTQLESEYGLHAGNTFHKALQRELYFLDSVLTSPLHRQSKSPTLWYHRSRIVDSLILVHLTDKLDDQKAVFRNKELGAVCKSGEQHPKNYHAWQYARRLVQKARGFGPDDQLSRLVKQWCCRHPSDISAPSLRQELFSIENESLWVFIRTALAQDVSSVDHSVTYRRLQDYVQNLANDERPQNEAHTASNALKWIDTYGKHIG
ncbi:hypothetical protein J3E74DRAFT_452282 [Bipolaris maydis]|nr:hypothetical protein J3E74DRAFT_452282 [Bipolaris maydis]